MANPFCCRGKLGALPIIALGFAFLISWHYLNTAFENSRRDDLQNEVRAQFRKGAANFRGAFQNDDLDAKLKAIEKIVPERNVMQEAELKPDHFIDGGAEEGLEQRLGKDLRENDIWAADEADAGVGPDSLQLAGINDIDSAGNRNVKRPQNVEQDIRAKELGIMIEDSIREGAVAPEDGMKFVDEDLEKAAEIDQIESPILPDKAELEEPVESEAKDHVGSATIGAEVSYDTSPSLKDFVQIILSVDGEFQSPMIFKLYKDDTPLTVANFEKLCDGWTNENGNHLTYDGVPFHRIISEFMMQGGQLKGPKPHSIYGEEWDDEPSALAIKHSKKGMLSIANHGPDTNASQFFITFKPAPHLDGRHGVFGELVSGVDTLDAVNKLEIANEKSVKPVILESCTTLDDFVGGDDRKN